MCLIREYLLRADQKKIWRYNHEIEEINKVMSFTLCSIQVSGNFHIAPGRAFQHGHSHTHDLLSYTVDQFNITHTINKLSFGDHVPGLV